MLKDSTGNRRAQLDKEMMILCYKRFKLCRELEDIDENILRMEGAMNENEAVQRDISTEEAITAAKKPEE
jgi:hypothetical protein